MPLFWNNFMGHFVEGALHFGLRLPETLTPAPSISGPLPRCQPHASGAVRLLCPRVVPVKALITSFNTVWAVLKTVTHPVIT